jgi:hypothetical protein
MYFCVLSLTIFLTLTLPACQMKSMKKAQNIFEEIQFKVPNQVKGSKILRQKKSISIF